MVRKSLGHYKIIRQVGSGGMGEVYAPRNVLPQEMETQ